MFAKRSTIFILSTAAGLLLAGCALRSASLSDLPEQDLAGHYTSEQGASWFRPCGVADADSRWWVTFTGRSVAQVEQARSTGLLQPGQQYYVRWKAAITTGGEIGPQGPGLPALLVRELLEVRPAADRDCAEPQVAR